NCSHVDQLNKNTLTIIKKFSNYDHSIVGLIEKMKLEKNFPDGKNALERLLFRTKIHLIRLIATDSMHPEGALSGEPNNANKLSPVHIAALYMYSSNQTILQNVNQCITNAKWNDKSIWN